MSHRLAIVLCVAALPLVGCNGPKESCEDSMKSYWALLKAHDWEGSYAMLTPEFKRKISADAYASGMQEIWVGSKKFSMNLDGLSESGASCFANGYMSYTVRIRGKEPVRFDDEYFSWIFRKQADNKWYIEMPGMERVQGW